MGKIRTLDDKTSRDRARRLRSEDTPSEATLWRALRDRRLGGWKWRRQVPVGPFVVDFLCSKARLVVEVDGGHHADQADYDARRTRHLEARGLCVLRFWNSAILTNLDGVCRDILTACHERASPHARVGRGKGEGRRVRT